MNGRIVSEKQHSIVLDVMGSDSGERGIIEGGLQAARSVGDSLQVIFVGRRELIEKVLDSSDSVPSNISIEDAEAEIPMEMAATDGLRMRNSSVAVGMKLVREGRADGFVSPGNTGAVMATAFLTLGRIEGVSRPGIAAVFPTSTGRPTIVMDVGANADCRPIHLSQFAVMGSVYYSIVYKHESPRVGLISIGEERSKGNELVFNTTELLKSSKINFVGNIEGRDILSGGVDVGITDGFTGNILLKFAESVKPLLVESVQRQIQTNIFSRAGVMLLLPFIRRMRELFSYEKMGGGPLLGVNGNVIICHGSANSRAMGNAVKTAYKMSVNKIRQRIHEELITNHFGQNNGSKNKSQNNRDRVVRSTEANDQ